MKNERKNLTSWDDLNGRSSTPQRMSAEYERALRDCDMHHAQARQRLRPLDQAEVDDSFTGTLEDHHWWFLAACFVCVAVVLILGASLASAGIAMNSIA